MKIWEAKLILFYNDNNEYETRFDFELKGDNYEVNGSFKEWTYSEGWICNRVPMEMIAESNHVLKIIQGFDKELNEEELKSLKEEMKIFIQRRLNYEKEIFLQRYDDKVKAIIFMEED